MNALLIGPRSHGSRKCALDQDLVAEVDRNERTILVNVCMESDTAASGFFCCAGRIAVLENLEFASVSDLVFRT